MIASADNTNYLTIELFNNKIDAIMSDIRLEHEKLQNQIHQLHSEIQDIKSDVRVITAQIANLQTSVYWSFAIIALVITIAIFFKGVKTEKKQNLTENQVIEVRNLVRDEYAKLKAGN